MKIGFYHDAPFVWHEGIYYTRSFGNHVWGRYLEVFDELIVSTRVRKGDPTGLTPSNLHDVTFQPITAYTGLKSIFTSLPRIMRQIHDSLSSVEGAIVRVPSVIGWFTFAVAKITGKPVLLEVVGCPWDAYRFHSGLGKLMAPLGYLSTRLAAKNAKFVIYVTQSFLQNRYPTNGESVGISNVNIAIDESTLENRLSRISGANSTTKLDKNTVAIGSIGNVDLRYKGFESAIKAVALLVQKGHSLQYEIVGGGDQKALNDLIHDLGVASNVRLKGLFTSDQVDEWLNSIDLYIQPSLTEGLPRAAIEAMSHGLPLLLSDAGGHPELVRKDYLYEPGNHLELAQKIEKLLTNGDWEEIARENFKTSLKYERTRLQVTRRNFLRRFLASLKEN